jgi:hypothetical protein
VELLKLPALCYWKIMQETNAYSRFAFLASLSVPLAVTCGTAVFLSFAIAAVVLANQQQPELILAGRVAHLISIAAACAVCLTTLGARMLPYVIGVAVIYGLNLLTNIRLPYEVMLSVLFLAAGAIIGANYREAAARTVITISILSGAMMFLQVVGAGEWTQALTTHGIIGNGIEVPKSPLPTLFLGYYEVQANFLQGRPAGLLHSNQFASLVILFALALSISREGERSWWVDAALCATAVLTLAKVVFLGIALLVAFYFLTGRRALAIRFAALTATFIVVYAVLFPGMFQIYFFSLHNVWQSIAARFVDVLMLAGFEPDQITAGLLRFDFGMRSSGELKDALIDRMLVQSTGRLSAITALTPHAVMIYAAASVAFLCFSINEGARRQVLDWIRSNIDREHISVALVLGAFCLAANFLGSQIFWMMAGFVVPLQDPTMGKSSA